MPSDYRDAAAGGVEGVILIHGLGRTRVSMLPLARRLRAEGFTVGMVGYPSLRLSIDAAVTRIARDVERLAKGWPTIHLVGHSLGGLLARRMAEARPDLPIGRVVQLGSPNAGTGLARTLAGYRPARWVLGPVLTEIAAIPRHVTIRAEVGALAGTRHWRWLNELVGPDGPSDGVVPLRSAWAGAGARAALPVYHTFLPTSARTAQLVAGFLRSGRFDATGVLA